MSDELQKKLDQLSQAHEAGLLDDDTYQASVDSLRAKYVAQVQSGAVAQGEGATAVGEKGINVDGNIGGDAVSGIKADIVNIHNYGDNGPPVEMDETMRETALGRYLEYVIAWNRYLVLRGIRSGGRVVHIELEQIYITLRASQQRTIQAEDRWLAEEASVIPGERQRETITETVTVSVNEALLAHKRLVVTGDPGSGKTTLLRYLTLIYARDLALGGQEVSEKLGLDESGYLPILLPLRRVGAFLRDRDQASTEGHKQLLEFLRTYLTDERIDIPLNFFDSYLQNGRAIILLDGLDEVASDKLRYRVSRLVEAFTRAYPNCRYIVTSRKVGYIGASRLEEAYVPSTVREFTLGDVKQFLTYWHRLLAAGQMGPGKAAEKHAASQTKQLFEALQENDRIRELAINPLMLTVIALVHRDRVKLPDRRAELYAEAVDVLLGKWDEARGVADQPVLENAIFDTIDRRLMLQAVALHMHEAGLKEIETEPLRQLLISQFRPMVREEREAERAVNRFLRVVEERTGLLTHRGGGVYAFSHLTFQEYLAALAVAGREDYVAYLLPRSGDPWWREVILLVAGHLSTQSKGRTVALIQAIAERREEPEPYHNLVLAAACLLDVGEKRIGGNLLESIQDRLRAGIEAPPPTFARWFKQVNITDWLRQRSAAMDAWVRSGGGFWTEPYGEPEWVTIPAGEFWMGSENGEANEKPLHQVHLPEYQIARVPITNAQYLRFVQAENYKAPSRWEDGQMPKGLESHPVVKVTWHDAMVYCWWLSKVTGKSITLPSEAEWEKAARGSQDVREYPWGNTFDRTRCSGGALGIGTTTPVGIFPTGASPYGVLDMAGTVREWTRNENAAYPYQHADGREKEQTGKWKMLRGGSFWCHADLLRCACRSEYSPYLRYDDVGFRVCVRPHFPASGR